MQIACPACQTRYSVPDGAIGAEGRTVRCAKCRHSWFEAGEGPASDTPTEPAAEAPGGEPSAPAAPQDAPAEQAEPAFAEPETPPQPMPASPDAYAESDAAGSVDEDTAWPDAPAVEAPIEEAAAVTTDAPVAAPVEEVDYAAPSADPVEEPVEEVVEPDWEEPAPRKSRLGLVLVVVLVLLAVAAAAFAAVRYYGAPDWLPAGQVAFAPPSEDLELDFPIEEQDRKVLPNGLQFFAASGTVTNVGDSTQHVPDVQVVLRDAQERIVYTWELEPPKRELAPGETLSINEAVTDVPASARVVEIGWKAG